MGVLEENQKEFHMAVVKKKKTTRRTTTPRIYNNGTMTNAMFWSFIRSALRQKSRWWKPITQCKINAKRPYKGPNKRQKFEYQCNKCKQWFSDKEVAVDHITPAGALNNGDDLKGFVERLFCEIDGLQCLCSSCHDKKTKLEKSKK